MHTAKEPDPRSPGPPLPHTAQRGQVCVYVCVCVDGSFFPRI